jgi:hypothetical protein
VKIGEWLSWFFGESDRRRIVIALAAALALHEIFAALVPWHPKRLFTEPIEKITIAKITRIEHRPTPTPKPTPRPTPTPQPVVRTKVIAETHTPTPIVNPGAPSEHQRVKRVASARPLIRTKFHSRPARIHVPMGGHGTGVSRTAKADTGGIGPGGSGRGVGGTGSGTGGTAAAHEPCGYVEFQPADQPTVDKGTGRVWERILMTVHFPDGTSENQSLDYMWYYPSLAADPWSKNDNSPVLFQFPPADQRPDEPPLVQYVMAHTDSDGFTKLKDCPK